MTDTQIIVAIQEGGAALEKALSHMFQQHRSFVGRGIKRYGLDESEALDAFTDSLLAIKRQISSNKFRQESKLSTYLFTIFSRRCVDQLRKRNDKTVRLTSEYEVIPDPEPGMTDKLHTSESIKRLEGYMDQLGEVCREILMYRYFYGYDDMAEIARLVGVKNANTAGSLRYRCMKQLLKIIKKTGAYGTF